MKKRNLFLTLGLSLTLGVGVAAGLGVSRVEAKEVDAASSGIVTLDVTQYWSSNENGQHFAVYFYEGEPGQDPTNSGWSSYVFGAQNKGLIEVSYNLSFTPDYMIAVRYANWYEENNQNHWAGHKWGHEGWQDTGKWNQTGDIAFVENAHINVHGWNDAVLSYAYIMSNKATPAWGNKMDLNHVKLNGTNHCEYYSTSVALTENEKIKVVYRNGYYGNGDVRISDFIKSGTFTFDGDANIVCNTPGTYAIYFDSLASNSGENFKVFITDPAAAAADEFAQSFLTKTNGYCNGEISESVQTTLKGEYDAMASIPGAQADFYTAEIKRGKNLTYASYASEALSRYINMQEEKGYGDFLVINALIPSSSAYVPTLENSNNNISLVIIVVSSVALIAAGSFFVIRRRKEQE